MKNQTKARLLETIPTGLSFFSGSDWKQMYQWMFYDQGTEDIVGRTFHVLTWYISLERNGRLFHFQDQERDFDTFCVDT